MQLEKVTPFSYVFYNDDGSVNVDLIGGILRQVQRPSPFLKHLYEFTGRRSNGKLSSDERIREIAQHLPRQDFREQWYTSSSSRLSQKSGWRPFHELIHFYLVAKDKDLRPASALMRDKFQLIKNSYFIKPEAVSKLVEVLIKKKIPSESFSLYIWSFLELHAWSFAKKQKISGYEKLRDAFILAMEANGLTSIERLAFEFPVVNEERADTADPGFNRHQREEDYEGAKNNVCTSDPVQEDIDLGKIEKLIKDASKEKILYVRAAEDLIRSGRSIVSGDFTEDRIGEITQLAAKLKKRQAELYKKCRSLDQVIVDEIDVCKSSLGIQVRNDEVLLTPDIKFGDWLGSKKLEFTNLRRLRIKLESLSKRIPLVGELDADVSPPNGEVSVLDAIEWVDSKIEEVDSVQRVQEETDAIRARVLQNHDNISWNLSRDELLSKDAWKIILRDILAHSTATNYLKGISLRASFGDRSFLEDPVVGCLTESLSSDIIGWLSDVTILSSSQLENLYEKVPPLQSWLTLALLNAFYQLGETNSNVAEQYWFWSPLSPYSRSDDAGPPPLKNTTITRLLKELYQLTRSGNVRTSSALQRLLQTSGWSESSECDTLPCGFSTLAEKVLIPPHFPSNYGRLCTMAFNDVFEPYRAAIEAKDYAKIEALYASQKRVFNLSAAYSKWCGQLPRFPSKESQYEKKVRSYIVERYSAIERLLSCPPPNVEHKTNSNDEVNIILRELRKETDQENVGACSDPFCSVFVKWLDEMCLNGGYSAPVFGFPGQSMGDLFSTEASLTPIPINLRSFCKDRRKESFTWGELATDLVVQWAGLVEPTKAAQLLVDWEEWEAAAAFCHELENQGQVIEEGLIEEIYTKESSEKNRYAGELKTLKRKVQLLPKDFSEDFPALIGEADAEFESGLWVRLESTMQSIEEWVKEIFSQLEAEQRRSELIEEIIELGGSPGIDMSVIELDELCNKLFDTNESRQKHISIIRKFLSDVSDDEMLRKVVEETLDSLNRAKFLPSTSEDSQELEYLFGEIFGRFGSDISRPGSLNELYLDNMLEAAYVLMAFLSEPAWIRDNKSNEWGVLVELATMVESMQGPDDVKKFLERLGHTGARREKASVVKVPIDTRETTSNAVGAGIEDRTDHLSSQERAPEDIVEDAAETLQRILAPIALESQVSPPDSYERIVSAVCSNDWERAADLCAACYKALTESEKKDQKALNRALCDFSFCYLNTESRVLEQINKCRAASLCLINSLEKSAVRQCIQARKDNSNFRKRLGQIVMDWLVGFQFGEIRRVSGGALIGKQEQISELLAYENYSVQTEDMQVCLIYAFGPASLHNEQELPSTILRLIWDWVSGAGKAADFRAWLMFQCYGSDEFGILRHCLQMQAVSMDYRNSSLLCQLLMAAKDGRNWDRMEEFARRCKENKKSQAYRRFLVWVANTRQIERDIPAKVSLVGNLEMTAEKTWAGVLEIVPRTIDPPMELIIKLPPIGNLRFSDNAKFALRFAGPFLEAVQKHVEFIVAKGESKHYDIEVTCEFTSINDNSSSAIQKWSINLASEYPFYPPSNDEIDRLFNQFPQNPMRGDQYIHRVDDEQIIEKLLFNGEYAGSVWITSPRRSGKSTMLFRILDAFSHKKGRDDAVIYFSLDRHFNTIVEFNQWVWRKLSRDKNNKELRDIYDEFDRLGEGLQFEDEANLFLEDLTDRLVGASDKIKQVFFVFDEADRFAEMYLDGGSRKEVCEDIMWQLRQIVMSDSNVGIVFAGSHPARSFFIKDSSAPFYNSIKSVRLSPFNVSSKNSENRSRQIVQPASLSQTFDVPKITLEHLLWVTAGIPYYMKLVAGATYVYSRQSHIVPADINIGVKRLLNHETGIAGIDTIENPGEDELNTLYSKTNDEMLVIKGVLYTTAKIRSPLDKGTVKIGELWNPRSPLVEHARLMRTQIEHGLQAAIDMGFLKYVDNRLDVKVEIEFVVPLLGESLRQRFGGAWAVIASKLESIGRSAKQ